MAGETNQRLWLGRVDVTELLDFLPFARAHVGQLLRATEHSHPAGAARSGAAFDRNWSFNATRIDGLPVARLIAGRTPCEVLSFAQLVSRAVVIFVPGYGPLLVYCFQKSEEALTVIFRTLAQNLFGRLLRMLAINSDGARRAFECCQS